MKKLLNRLKELFCLNKEKRRDIDGYEGYYQISNKGRIKSLGNNKTRKEKILKARFNKYGIATIHLYKNGKSKNYLIKELVGNKKSESERGNTKRIVLQYTQDGILIKKHRSLTAAAKSVGGTMQGVYNCCSNRQINHKGYMWRYE